MGTEDRRTHTRALGRFARSAGEAKPGGSPREKTRGCESGRHVWEPVAPRPGTAGTCGPGGPSVARELGGSTRVLLRGEKTPRQDRLDRPRAFPKHARVSPGRVFAVPRGAQPVPRGAQPHTVHSRSTRTPPAGSLSRVPPPLPPRRLPPAYRVTCDRIYTGHAVNVLAPLQDAAARKRHVKHNSGHKSSPGCTSLSHSAKNPCAF